MTPPVQVRGSRLFKIQVLLARNRSILRSPAARIILSTPPETPTIHIFRLAQLPGLPPIPACGVLSLLDPVEVLSLPIHPPSNLLPATNTSFPMAESKKKNGHPPAVPSKEPIVNQEKPEPAAEPTKKPDPQSDAKSKAVPTPRSQDEMAGGSSQGQIPLDDMRSKLNYIDAVTGFEEKEMGPPPRSKPKARSISEKDFEGSSDRDVDRNMLMDLDPVASASVVDLPSLEDFGDALTHQEPLARKSSLQPTVEEEEPDDLPAGYEKSSFTRRKDPTSKVHEENTRLRRHAQDLSRKINTLITEKQIAEEKADRATERITEMKQSLNSGMTDIERDTESLARDLEKSREENRALREQLNDAQSHIFSLQPYRKDLTSEEIGRVSISDHLPPWRQ